MAPTTSRLTSHPRKTLLIVRQGPAAPKAEGLISEARGLGHYSPEGYLFFARSSILVDMLLGNQYGVAVSCFGCDVEQHPGFASTHAGERSGAYALISRDEPHLVVAVRLGLVKVVELQLDLLVARGLQADFGYSPVPFESGGFLGGWNQLDGCYRGFFSQEAEENPKSHHANHGRCCHAWENDARRLEAGEAVTSQSSPPY